jgi:hypothetical protein
MSKLMSRSKFWVAFDSGLTPVSRKHLEETIINHAAKLGVKLDWLVSHQLTSGARRIAFTFAASDEEKLNKLLTDLNAHFPSFAGDAELSDLVKISNSKSSGRAVVMPLEVDISATVQAETLIKNSAIDSIVAIGEELPPKAEIQINNFLRPTFAGGKLELYVERVAGGFFAPVERESPHECCGGHDDEAPISL